MRRKLNKLIVFIENQNTSIAVSKKERLVLILLTFMVVESILFKIFTTPDSWMYTVVVGSVTIFAIFLLVIKKKGKFIEQYKLKYFILLEIVGVSFVFNGIYFGTLAYLAIGITFSVVIPTIHYAFSMINKDIDMMEIMAKGIILAFILCFVASMLFGPGLGSEQYKGLFPNPNLLGYFEYCICSFSAYGNERGYI